MTIYFYHSITADWQRSHSFHSFTWYDSLLTECPGLLRYVASSHHIVLHMKSDVFDFSNVLVDGKKTDLTPVEETYAVATDDLQTCWLYSTSV